MAAENLYQKLVRRSWESGEYKAGPSEREESSAALEGKELRKFLRSKMEWVVEREAYDPDFQSRDQEDRTMKLAQFVKFREEKFGGVLFETRSEKVYTLSQTGSAVVKEIAAEGGDAKAVIERLKTKFDDKDGSIEKDASEFIEELKTKGLLVE
jgi:DNA-binding PadR family transcriptional regulator